MFNVSVPYYFHRVIYYTRYFKPNSYKDSSEVKIAG
jgi:hypothetical protein